MQLLSEKITALVQEAEEAGTRGDVEQAQGLMKLCDRLKEEKEQLLKQQENRYEQSLHVTYVGAANRSYDRNYYLNTAPLMIR